MNKTAYYVLVVIIVAFMILGTAMIPYSLEKLKKRKKDCIYIHRLFLFFGYYCLANAWFIFVGAILIAKLDYLFHNMRYIVMAMYILGVVGTFLVWIWSHYEIKILEDRFIYSRCFWGKIEIPFDQIDIKNSRYQFIQPKHKRDFMDEALKLKMLNGKEYKFLFVDLLQEGSDLLMTNTIIFKLKIAREFVKRR